jgi:hypothetical protein
MCKFSMSSRIIAKFVITLVVIYFICPMNGTALAKYRGGSGTPLDPYRIGTVADWQTLMNDSADWNKQFILTADIDLTGVSLTPVGNIFPNTLFLGTFDGNGHIISNANISTSGNDYVGLFGGLGPNGQIRNLSLNNIKIIGHDYAGALVGYNWDGIITSCSAAGSVKGNITVGGLVGKNYKGNITQSTSSCTTDGENYVGGFAGYNDNGSLTQCYSTGTVSGNTSVGGLTGYNSSGSIAQCYSTGLVSGRYNTGGLVGYNNDKISQSYSTGIVDADDYVGGLVGYNKNGNISQSRSTGAVSGNYDVGGLVGINEEGLLSYCYSSGIISSLLSAGGLVGDNKSGTLAQCYSTGAVASKYDAGGLVGCNSGDVNECFSTSTVTGEDYAGGLVGWNGGDVNDCYCSGKVNGSNIYIGGLIGENEGSVIRCYSTGTVYGKYYIGGLVGCGLGVVSNSVWDMQTSGLYGSSGGVGLTTEKMKDAYLLGLNGFSNEKKWILDAGRDYPRLAWQGTAGTVIPDPGIINWLEGNGTAITPYKIYTAEQIILIGKSSILWDKNFTLEADINLDLNLINKNVLNPNLVDPNGNDGLLFGQAVIPTLKGVFDGKGHIISKLTAKGDSFMGLFGRLDSKAKVQNVSVNDVNIIDIGRYTGGLAGYNNGGLIIQCCTTGLISGNLNVGGLVGYNDTASISVSYSKMNVSGNTSIGGLVGSNFQSAITNCYSTGSTGGKYYIGGLIGDNYNSIVTYCYSTGLVSSSYIVGGLAGNGLTADVMQSFWDIQTSGKTTSAGGTGKTTTEMKNIITFTSAGWDFLRQTSNGIDGIWWINEKQNYPQLFWEAVTI